MEPGSEVGKLLRQYHALLVEMHENRIEVVGKPRNWNRLFDRLQSVQLLLRTSVEGRAGITALALGDDCSTVKIGAASHALFWDEALVRPVLQSAALEQHIAGLEAEITLREFDAGRLNMEWVPKGR